MKNYGALGLLNNMSEIAKKTNSLKDWITVFIIYLIFYIGVIIGIVLSLIILYYVTIFYLKFFCFLLKKLEVLYREEI